MENKTRVIIRLYLTEYVLRTLIIMKKVLLSFHRLLYSSFIENTLKYFCTILFFFFLYYYKLRKWNCNSVKFLFPYTYTVLLNPELFILEPNSELWAEEFDQICYKISWISGTWLMDQSDVIILFGTSGQWHIQKSFFNIIPWYYLTTCKWVKLSMCCALFICNIRKLWITYLSTVLNTEKVTISCACDIWVGLLGNQCVAMYLESK